MDDDRSHDPPHQTEPAADVQREEPDKPAQDDPHEIEDAARQEGEYPADETLEG